MERGRKKCHIIKSNFFELCNTKFLFVVDTYYLYLCDRYFFYFFILFDFATVNHSCIIKPPKLNNFQPVFNNRFLTLYCD